MNNSCWFIVNCIEISFFCTKTHVYCSNWMIFLLHSNLLPFTDSRILNSMGFPLFATEFRINRCSVAGFGWVKGRRSQFICRCSIAWWKQAKKYLAIGWTYFVGIHVHHIAPIWNVCVASDSRYFRLSSYGYGHNWL